MLKFCQKKEGSPRQTAWIVRDSFLLGWDIKGAGHFRSVAHHVFLGGSGIEFSSLLTKGLRPQGSQVLCVLRHIYLSQLNMQSMGGKSMDGKPILTSREYHSPLDVMFVHVGHMMLYICSWFDHPFVQTNTI